MLPYAINQTRGCFRFSLTIDHDLTGSIAASDNPPLDIAARIAPLQRTDVLEMVNRSFAKRAGYFCRHLSGRFFQVFSGAILVPTDAGKFLS